MIILPPVWLLLSMLPLFQTFIIDYTCNYVGSLVPIIYELLLQLAGVPVGGEIISVSDLYEI